MFHLLGNCIFSVYVILRCFNGGVVMETLEQLKDIVKNSPEGATHCNDVGEYGCYSVGDYFSRWTPENMNPTVNCNWRSLSDIKRIIELMEAVNSLPDKLETDRWLKGLDRPTEFAISQAKSFAIGSVFDSIRKAKELS